nr:hypothetical protein [Caldisericia bacterium]
NGSLIVSFSRTLLHQLFGVGSDAKSVSADPPVVAPAGGGGGAPPPPEGHQPYGLKAVEPLVP